MPAETKNNSKKDATKEVTDTKKKSKTEEEIIQENLKAILDKKSREERKANGRLVAIIVAFLVIFLAIYHAWIRKSAVLAGVLVPAFIMISYGSWVVIQTKRDKQKKALFEKHLKEVALKNKTELEQKAKLKHAKKIDNKSATETTLHIENELPRKQKSQLYKEKNNTRSNTEQSNSSSNSSTLSGDHRKHRKRRERQRSTAVGNENVLIHQTANKDLRIKRPSIRQKIFGQKTTQLHYDYMKNIAVASTADINGGVTISTNAAISTQPKKKRILQRLNALSTPQLVRTGSAP